MIAPNILDNIPKNHYIVFLESTKWITATLLEIVCISCYGKMDFWAHMLTQEYSQLYYNM
jgi:hypothetical protein